MGALRIGLDAYPMQVTWSEMRDLAQTADAAGIDSLWTWDHLYGTDDPAHTIFEGWAVISAWAAITHHATIGLLVGANTLRNPGVVAKAAVTVDHISGGRCILGLGGGWRPREHLDHGIDLGSGYGDRLAWLDEAAGAIRALLRGASVTSGAGARYAFRDLSHQPSPFRGPGCLPMLIGGGGERWTLPAVARHADLWHHRGSLETLSRKRDLLFGHCVATGRDPAEIELCFGPYVIVRDDPSEARRVLEQAFRHNDEGWDGDTDTAWLGPPEAIAERWRPFVDAGFRHLIAAIAGPYDRETIERLPQVRDLLA